jgi:hypothetical protein
MRLTSTGLGIGTSSPSQKLEVSATDSSSAIGASSAAIRITNMYTGAFNQSSDLVFDAGGFKLAAVSGVYTNFSSSPGGAIVFSTNNGAGSFAERMRLDSSGNLGLGVTPSAWSVLNAIEMKNGTSLAAHITVPLTFVNANCFYNGTNWIYKTSYPANQYIQDATEGQHKWFNAPSGTAGDAISFSQVMTLDASGRLGVGTTSPANPLSVSGSTGTLASFTNGATADFSIICGSSITSLNAGGANILAFQTGGTERARIDSSGNLLVGTTTAYGRVVGKGTGAGSPGMVAICDTVSIEAIGVWSQATSGDNLLVNFGTEGTFTSRGSITYNRAGGLVAYNTTSDYRAKDITGPVTDSGTLIDSTPVYMGKMKGATQERPMFIAHEVPAYAHTGEKDAVDADGKPVYQQMDASALIPVMWAEIQSLRARLAAANI